MQIPTLQNNKNQTALIMQNAACKNCQSSSVYGADPNLQNDFGRTALMYSLAVSSHELDDCIPVLLKLERTQIYSQKLVLQH